MKLPIDKKWFEKRVAAEGDLEIGAGNHKLTMTLDLTDDEIGKLEELALQALPEWARDRITCMRSALIAIRDIDDIHPASSTHDVELSRHRFRDIARQALAGYSPPAPSGVVPDRLLEAAHGVICAASDSYKKRNGHLASFEDDSGEKCWIVPFDAFETLRSALTAPASEGSPHGH